MRGAVVLALAFSTGCSYYTLNPGHRGLRFDPHDGGLHTPGLQPGIYNLGWCFLRECGEMQHFYTTYTTHKEIVHTTSSEGLVMDTHLAIIYRPIVAELY